MPSIATPSPTSAANLEFEQFQQTVLADYRLACLSREASLLGRKEVLTGKAKFGIFGDGKEVAQLAMAKVFAPGDFRSGYYRDQTFMFATGNLTVQQWFAGLYAHPDPESEPMSAGRQMGGHFCTHSLDANGNWRNLMEQRNSSADISPTAGQMPRLLGLAQASVMYRNLPGLESFVQFSNKGNEVAFGTIGDASTSEGLFWETMNAAAVLQVPMVMCVWDDGHGISVPKRYQTARESISESLSGMQRDEKHANGIEILKTKGWNYAHLCETFARASELSRREHVPVLVHVEEVTQPQGHSTSGSHERYKSKERLAWENDFDCIVQMRNWMLENGIASEEDCTSIESEAREQVKQAKKAAWEAYLRPITQEQKTVAELLKSLARESLRTEEILVLAEKLSSDREPFRRDVVSAARQGLRMTMGLNIPSRNQLESWLKNALVENADRYSSHLLSESERSPLRIQPIAPQYNEERLVDGREILRDNFDAILGAKPEVVIFGEDVGGIGDVNQGCEGLQKKYGVLRVSDTGIREATILGQGIGMAMRGLRPIAEIQYLDYLLYALQIMSDDLATVRYRTKGKQMAPLIVRTRGHRLEGIWHSGSPMGMILNSLRGIHVCVPRNMTVAAGFYNTLLEGDDPGLIIECLNGYRLKEKMPSNLGQFRVALGQPEWLRSGNDVTLLTYGSCCRIAEEASKNLEAVGISVDLIDAQTLLPFDVDHKTVESLRRTNRLVVLDEDVPGGASAYLLQQVLEVQGGYRFLDSAPITITSKAHRPAYGSDGDYFSKPSVDDVFEQVYDMMHEADPNRFQRR
jgi:pyruvate/2-oxoglutarate/acetoin dehydrogenase E1 component/TPP-dependent pyruvate/acetoin dehydrogenase alpha subunit